MGTLLTITEKTPPHPCFDETAKGACGRIHLPVAPGCNIQCGYCSRAFDCVNESRPGVTSRVMEPEEAVVYLTGMLHRMPFVTVAGIAGPGDAFCDPDRTMRTLEMVRRSFPRLNLCLSTNGLGIGPHIDDLAGLSVGYVTITVNAATPETGALIYSHIRTRSGILKGVEGAGFLLAAQMDSIAALSAKDIVVKVNTVVISGINENEIEKIACLVSKPGADIMNIIPAIPVPGTAFEQAPPLSSSELNKLRMRAAAHIRQMRHCVRCRADAAGLLDFHEGRGPAVCPEVHSFGPDAAIL